MADILYQFTPHVLGVKCEVGGCGGKSSYTTTGIINTLKAFGLKNSSSDNITIIGSAGALGTSLVSSLTRLNINNIQSM